MTPGFVSLTLVVILNYLIYSQVDGVSILQNFTLGSVKPITGLHASSTKKYYHGRNDLNVLKENSEGSLIEKVPLAVQDNQRSNSKDQISSSIRTLKQRVETKTFRAGKKDVRDCQPCKLWDYKSKEKKKPRSGPVPNLTIIPMAAIFVFITLIVFKCISWSNEDIRLADERFIKTNVPVIPEIKEPSPQNRKRRHSKMRRPHRRSSVSISNAKTLQKFHPPPEGESSTSESSGEEGAKPEGDRSKSHMPAAAAAYLARSGRRHSLVRPHKRLFRRPSFYAGSETLPGLDEFRRKHNIFPLKERDDNIDNLNKHLSSSAEENRTDCFGISDHGQHSKAETSFTSTTISFRRHLLAPPSVHFQLSNGSMETSTTSLGESVPSIASKVSICDSNTTEQFFLSDDEGSNTNEDNTSDLRLKPKCYGGGDVKSFSISPFNDPLVFSCKYTELNETVSHSRSSRLFTIGSSGSLESAAANTGASNTNSLDSIPQLCNSQNRPNDAHSDTQSSNTQTTAPIFSVDNDDADDTSSECNSETALTYAMSEDIRDEEGQCWESLQHKQLKVDSGLYEKSSVEPDGSPRLVDLRSAPVSPVSVDSAFSLNRKMIFQTETSVSSSLRALNLFETRTQKDTATMKKDGIHLIRLSSCENRTDLKVDNGRVIRMCRSWCLGDKAFDLPDNLQQNKLEQECFTK